MGSYVGRGAGDYLPQNLFKQPSVNDRQLIRYWSGKSWKWKTIRYRKDGRKVELLVIGQYPNGILCRNMNKRQRVPLVFLSWGDMAILGIEE